MVYDDNVPTIGQCCNLLLGGLPRFKSKKFGMDSVLGFNYFVSFEDEGTTKKMSILLPQIAGYKGESDSIEKKNLFFSNTTGVQKSVIENIGNIKVIKDYKKAREIIRNQKYSEGSEKKVNLLLKALLQSEDFRNKVLIAFGAQLVMTFIAWLAVPGSFLPVFTVFSVYIFTLVILFATSGKKGLIEEYYRFLRYNAHLHLFYETMVSIYPLGVVEWKNNFIPTLVFLVPEEELKNWMPCLTSTQNVSIEKLVSLVKKSDKNLQNTD